MSARSFDLARNVLAVLAIAGMIIASFWILYPFLSALIWATLLVVSTWSLMLSVQAKLWDRRRLAVIVMTVALVLLVIAPLAAAVATIFRNADMLAERFQAVQQWTIPPVPAWAERLPLVGETVARRWDELSTMTAAELHGQIEPYGKEITRWLLQKAGSLAVFFLHLALTVIIAAILFAHGDALAEGVRAFSRRLVGARGDRLTKLAAQAIRAVALGVIVTALVEALLSGIGFLAAGVPFPALLTALIFIMAVAQIGPGPVLILVILWLYWRGDSALVATAFLVWSVLIAAVDHLLRPILIKRGADLPLVLIFAGVVGGLVAFGAMGLFIGPVVLAVAYTLLIGWIRHPPGTENEDALSGNPEV